MSEYDKIADRAIPPAADVETLLRNLVADLLAALEGMQQADGCFDDCRWEYSGRHRSMCLEARAAIAKARGSV